MSRDADLIAALQLLQEAADYLERLPTVPATRHLADRLRWHLANPRARHALQAPAIALHGRGPFTPAGLPLLEASIADYVLTVGMPSQLHGAAREHVLRELLQELKHRPALSLQLSAE